MDPEEVKRLKDLAKQRKKREKRNRHTTFFGIPKINGKGIAHIMRNCKGLRTLDISQCVFVTDTCIRDIVSAAQEALDRALEAGTLALTRTRSHTLAHARTSASCRRSVITTRAAAADEERKRKEKEEEEEMEAGVEERRDGTAVAGTRRGGKVTVDVTHSRSRHSSRKSRKGGGEAKNDSEAEAPKRKKVQWAKSLKTVLREERQRVQNLAPLHKLVVSGCQLSDMALKALAKWEYLLHLSVSRCDDLTDVGGVALTSNCVRLKVRATIRPCTCCHHVHHMCWVCVLLARPVGSLCRWRTATA